MMHGQTDNFVSHLRGNGKVLFRCTGQTSISGEVADEGVEVASAEDALLAHLEVQFVSGHAVAVGVDEDGEVGVVVLHIGEVVPELDAVNVFESFAVFDGNLMACLDGGIHLSEVEQSVGGAHLVHLGVDAGGDHLGLSREAEVLQVVDAALGPLVVHDHGTALDGVVHLGGMEGEG